jgi:hypothetical protein
MRRCNRSYRKRAIVIEAVKWAGDNVQEIVDNR